MKKCVFLLIPFILMSGPVYAEIVNGIACKVGSTIITINEFNRAYEREKNKALLTGTEQPDKSAVMNILINNLLIKIEAEDKGIIVTDDELDTIIEKIMKQNNLSKEEFLRELEREKITIDELKETYKIDILKTRLTHQLVSDKVNVISEDEIKDFYIDPVNKRVFTTPESVKLSQIFIPVPEDATYKEAMEIKKHAVEIYDRAKGGENFRDLVQIYSMAPNKEDTLGYLGSFTREQLLNFMKPEDVEAIFFLDPGDVSVPLRFSDGYYIIKIDEKNEKTLLSFDKAYENIKSYLLKLKGEEIFQDRLLSLRQAVKVHYMIVME